MNIPHQEKIPEEVSPLLKEAVYNYFSSFWEVFWKVPTLEADIRELADYEIIAWTLLHGDYTHFKNLKDEYYQEIPDEKLRSFVDATIDYVILFKNTFYNYDLNNDERTIVQHLQKRFPRQPKQGIYSTNNLTLNIKDFLSKF